jgi:hypothetical protein
MLDGQEPHQQPNFWDLARVVAKPRRERPDEEQQNQEDDPLHVQPPLPNDPTDTMRQFERRKAASECELIARC